MQNLHSISTTSNHFQAICLPSPEGDFKTPSGKNFSRAEALGFEATAGGMSRTLDPTTQTIHHELGTTFALYVSICVKPWFPASAEEKLEPF
jgi:hypothetical protein